MAFALLPDDGLPRLFRFYKGYDDDPLAMLVKQDNLLIINRTKYDQLSPLQQNVVLRTHRELIP